MPSALFWFVYLIIRRLILAFLSLVGFYFLVTAPPLQLYFHVLPPAGPSTVYVPGSGFSGFWYHLGALQSIPNLHDYDYYCYSSGCLSIVLAMLNTSVQDVATVAFDIQAEWENGTLHRYDMTEQFVHRLIVEPLLLLSSSLSSSLEEEQQQQQQMPNLQMQLDAEVDQEDGQTSPTTSALAENQTWWLTMASTNSYNTTSDHQQSFHHHHHHSNNVLNRLNILVTSVQDGVVVRKPGNLTQLKDYLIQTAWIPFVTGWGVPEDPHTGNLHLDGGFSRVLHPPCEFHLSVPLTWELTWHTLNPALNRHLVWKFWNFGRQRGNSNDHHDHHQGNQNPFLSPPQQQRRSLPTEKEEQINVMENNIQSANNSSATPSSSVRHHRRSEMNALGEVHAY